MSEETAAVVEEVMETPAPKSKPKKTEVSTRTLKKHIKDRDARIVELEAELEAEKNKSSHYFQKMKVAQDEVRALKEVNMATVNNVRQQLETMTNNIGLLAYLGGK